MLSLLPWVSQSHLTFHLAAACSLDFKEDILQYDSTELSFALSRFIKELRRPNGDTYSPDSIFYLCLGIQQVHSTQFLVSIFVFTIILTNLLLSSISIFSWRAVLRTFLQTSCMVSLPVKSVQCFNSGNPSCCRMVDCFFYILLHVPGCICNILDA